MSDTPRTDDQTFDIECIRGDAHLGRHVYPCGSGDYVESNFSRQLERELTEARTRIKELAEAGNDLVWWFCQGEPSQLSPTQSAALKRWRDLRGRRNP